MIEKARTPRSMAGQFTRDYLIVSIIPLILLLLLVLIGTNITRAYLADLIRHSTYDLNMDAERSLQQLGEKIIQQKARDVAKQLEIYFRMHPDKSIQEMRNDPLFMELAIQKVGETGYTALTEAHTYLFRVHPNSKLNDRDMRFLKEKMPDWWKIVQGGIYGDETSGYYNWIEPDGSVRKKYLVATPVKIPLKGIIMMVSATTYIDEFSAPIVEMREKAGSIAEHYQRYVLKQWFIFGLIAGGVLFLTFIGTYLLGRKAAFRYILPIMKLSRDAQELGKGNWDVAHGKDILEREDEIGILAQALNRMSVQMKDFIGRLEQRVDELNKAQKAVKKSEEHYRGLFDGVPVGLYRTSEDGRILDANPMLVKMLGYPDRETFIARKADEIYRDPSERDVWKAGMEENGSVYSYETRFLKYDGTEIWVENHSRAVWDEKGRALYYEGSIKDISEKKRLEAQLQHIERMEAIGTLAGGVAHDFNNLLMAILGNITLMQHTLEADHPLHKHLTNIENQINRGARLTSQLLGYARKGKYEIRPLDLNRTVEESAETFCRTRKDIVLHTDMDPNLQTVEADVYQIEQMLMNIFVNASDAMPDGGDLFIKTENVHSDDMTSKAYKPKAGPYVMLKIEDTGIGMDKKTIDRVFDPFFTTKSMGRGTGLGLSSVYGIVKSHDGYIDAASEEGQGASFSIFFPASGKKPVREPAEAQKPSKGIGKILLVEDEEDVLKVGARMLEILGYTVLEAPGGREAVEIYKEQKDSIDLVLLDVIMPDMSGSQTFDLLKEINPDVSVLLSSGYTLDERAKRILERGCKGFIQKPYSAKALSEKIKAIIEKN